MYGPLGSTRVWKHFRRTRWTRRINSRLIADGAAEEKENCEITITTTDARFNLTSEKFQRKLRYGKTEGTKMADGPRRRSATSSCPVTASAVRCQGVRVSGSFRKSNGICTVFRSAAEVVCRARPRPIITVARDTIRQPRTAAWIFYFEQSITWRTLIDSYRLM